METPASLALLIRTIAPSGKYSCFPNLGGASRVKTLSCNSSVKQMSHELAGDDFNADVLTNASDTTSGSDSKEEEEYDRVNVIFYPGQKLGLTLWACAGTVTDVVADSQADRAGVKPGWAVVEINGRDYSYTYFKAHASANEEFIVTFNTQADNSTATLLTNEPAVPPNEIADDEKVVFKCDSCQLIFYRSGGPQNLGLLEITIFPGPTDVDTLSPIMVTLASWCERGLLKTDFVGIYDISAMSTPSVFSIYSINEEFKRQMPSCEAFRTHQQCFSIMRGDSYMFNTFIDGAITLCGCETLPFFGDNREDCLKALNDVINKVEVAQNVILP